MLPDVENLSLAEGLAVALFAGYLLMEWNNRSALLRVRSRMVSVTYLVLTTACTFLHDSALSLLPGVLLLLSYHALSASYQKSRSEGEIFHAFLFMSAGSLVFPPLLLSLPLFFVSMQMQLRSLTWRTFFAGLFGLAVPYWFWVAWAVWHNRLDTAFGSMPVFAVAAGLPDYGLLDAARIASAALVVLLVLLSLLHILRTSYNDKIRTRMIFYAVMVQEVLYLALLAVCPQWFDTLFALLLANSAPLLGHYFTLARGRFMNRWFVVCLLSVAVLGAANYFELWNLL